MSPAQSRALLSALSTELMIMRESVESVSAMVADHVGRCDGESRVRALVDAQSIDALSQRLEALSGVTAALARGDDLETALAGVRLADLSLRLGGTAPAPCPVQVVRPVAGDLMLFE